MVNRMIRRWHERERARLRQALNHPAASGWENLGLWSHASQPYEEAARALAMRVGNAAGLKPGDSVLDIGPGQSTDQRDLWTDGFSIGQYYGWERTTPAPPVSTWQHILAVDSGYFLPNLLQRWEQLWPQVDRGGAITWTDLYLARPVDRRRMKLRLKLTSALAGINSAHWLTCDQWLNRLSIVTGGTDDASTHFEDLTDEVLSGFVRHMDWRKNNGQRQSALRLAYGTATLLRPLLAEGVIGYGLFQLHRQ